jgi:hypothetical protein
LKGFELPGGLDRNQIPIIIMPMSNCNHTRNDSWWENDVRGIPLARVCDKCIKEKLSSYSAVVLTEEQQKIAFGRVITTECPYCPDEQVEDDR